jgi:hypothetical protein
VWTGHYSSRRGPMAGSCEHGNERSDFIMVGEFLNKLSDYHLLKKGSAPWTKLACMFIKQGNGTAAVVSAWVPTCLHFIAGDGKCLRFRRVRACYDEVMSNMLNCLMRTADLVSQVTTSF